jgi:hypothetical protein
MTHSVRRDHRFCRLRRLRLRLDPGRGVDQLLGHCTRMGVPTVLAAMLASGCVKHGDSRSSQRSTMGMSDPFRAACYWGVGHLQCNQCRLHDYNVLEPRRHGYLVLGPLLTYMYMATRMWLAVEELAPEICVNCT